MNRRSNDVTAQGAAILSWLRQRESEMAALLADLVAIPTENPPGKNYRIGVDFLSHLRQVGLDCERLGLGASRDDAANSLESLLASYGSGERALYFHGHYDVAPAQTSAQFQPQRKDHFLFGRGSADMKGGIVAMLYAIRALKEIAADLKGRIGLTVVPNEEVGGTDGTAWLAQQGLLGRDGIGMLLAEPTSGVVWNANRGAISLRVRVFGKHAHVGLQHQGKNAFERMHAVVEKLQQLKREVEQRTTRFNILSQQARNSILMLGGESGGGTSPLTVGAIQKKALPRKKTMLLDVLERCKQDGIPPDWDILQECASTFCGEDGPLGKALSQSVHAVTGEAPRFEMCPGLLEIRFYAAQGMPAFAYGGIALRGAWPKQIRRPEKNRRHRRHLCTDSDRNASCIVSALSL